MLPAIASRQHAEIHRYGLRGNDHPGSQSLQAVHDDQFSRFETLFYDAQSVDQSPQSHRTVFERAIAIDDEHEAAILVGTDRSIIDQDCRTTLTTD
jgi:hypothetical protein